LLPHLQDLLLRGLLWNPLWDRLQWDLLLWSPLRDLLRRDPLRVRRLKRYR
jgi:hypothetical protein